MTDLGDRRTVAETDTGRAHHANPGTCAALQFMQQIFRAHHRASERVADANGQGRDVRLAFLHHIEMGVEGRGLEHFREGKIHLVGKRGEVGRGDLMIFVLDEMQMLDQEIAPPRPVAEQGFDLLRGDRIDLASLGRGFGPPAPLARMFERADFLNVMTYRNVSFLPLLLFWSNPNVWHARCQAQLRNSHKHLRGTQPSLSCPFFLVAVAKPHQVLSMQSSI